MSETDGDRDGTVVDRQRDVDFVEGRVNDRHSNDDPDETLEIAGVEAGAPTRSSSIPELLGTFRCLEILGEGGMGRVYLAEQEEPRRLVALKVIRGAKWSAKARLRFELERRNLARLTHPNIAQLYESGELGEGEPYIAMELIDGAPLVAACDHRRLDLRQRVALFIEVCRAVEHAHRQGVLHRDLKPSNVLVTEIDGRPTVKVIDFGIAKSLDEEARELTMHGVVGTPHYMAPEVLAGESLGIDTRCDVYALGVMFCELIGGNRPIDTVDLQLPQLIQRIKSTEAVGPATLMDRLDPQEQQEIADQRSSTPARLQDRIRGDLQWIVLKAVAREVDRRYQSVGALADDLQAHLDDQPISAAPPSLVYLARKLMRRHRLAVGAATIVVLTSIAAFAAVTNALVDARRAQREADMVIEFQQRQWQAATKFNRASQETTAIDLLDAAAVEIDTAFGEEPRVRQRLLGSIGTSYFHLARLRRATAFLGESLELAREIYGERSWQSAGALNTLAIALKTSDRAQAAELIREAIAIKREFPKRRGALARAVYDGATILEGIEAPDVVEAMLRESLALRGEATGRLRSRGSLIEFLHVDHRFSEALELVPAQRADLAAPGVSVYLRSQLAGDLGGLLGEMGHLDEAAQLLVISRDGLIQILGPDDPSVGDVTNNLGILHREIGELDRALELLEEAGRIYVANSPDDYRISGPMIEVGLIHLERGELELAEAKLWEAREIAMRHLPASHRWTSWTDYGLGLIAIERGELDIAAEHLALVFEVRSAELPDDHPEMVDIRSALQRLEAARQR